jgi:hypothetical protein
MAGDRIVIGKLKSNLKAARDRSKVVIDMAPGTGVGGYEAQDSVGAIEVVHTISPELKQRLDAVGDGARSMSAAIKIGLVILAIAIAVAIGAALIYASMQLSRSSRSLGASRAVSRNVRKKVSKARRRAA